MAKRKVGDDVAVYAKDHATLDSFYTEIKKEMKLEKIPLDTSFTAVSELQKRVGRMYFAIYGSLYQGALDKIAAAYPTAGTSEIATVTHHFVQLCVVRYLVENTKVSMKS